jgi:type IV pilus secretin PilQ/predicted competence protein
MKTRAVIMRNSRYCRKFQLPIASILLLVLISPFSPDGIAQKLPEIKPAGEALSLPNATSAVKLSNTAKPSIGIISNITKNQQDNDLVISLETSSALAHQEFLLDNPSRLVIDFPNAENQVAFLQMPIKSQKVKKLRIRQFQSSDPKIVRLVFDLEDGYGKYEVASNEKEFQIRFHAADTSAPLMPAKEAEASNARSGDTKAEVAKPADDNPSPSKSVKTEGPVIRDLSNSEIPISALAAAKPEDKTIRNPESAPKQSALAAQARAVPTQASKVSLSPILIMNSSQNSQYGGQPLTLDLIDIPLVDFFRLMAEEGGINIVMDPEIKGTISIKVVKVPWDQIFDAALANNSLDKQIEGNLVRIARKTTLQEEAKQRESLKKANILAADVETRIKRLNYAKANNFLDMLAEQKSVRGTVVVDERTNSLILTDIPGSLDKMSQLIESLDVAQPQVEIEARIVAATRNFARDIGVQFGFVQGNLERVTVSGPNVFAGGSGYRPSATPVNTFAAGSTVSGKGASDSKATESAGISTGTASNDAGNFNVNLAAQKAFGGLGLSIGNIFDTFLLDAAITAGETKGLAKLISQPKLTVTNNTAGYITQGLRFPVQVIANNTITVQFQNAALTLTVTPQITYEGNVVLDLKVENNTADFSNKVLGIPSIRTSESATRALVSDGGTTVIGGILIEDESNQVDSIPGLASLPFIGNMFKRTSVYRQTQEIIFFVTPRIIK